MSTARTSDTPARATWTTIALSVGLAIALPGCAPNSDIRVEGVRGTPTVKGQATTTHELMESWNPDFKKATSKFGSGETPYMMGYDTSNGHGMMTVSDPDMIASAWERLADVSLIGPNPDAPATAEGQTQFTFVWADGTRIPFMFVTSEWFRGPDRRMYYVMDDTAVSAHMRKTKESAIQADAQESKGTAKAKSNDVGAETQPRA